MSQDLEREAYTKLIVLVTLFVTAPIVFCIDIYLIYKIVMKELVTTDLDLQGKVGLLLIFIGAPLFIYCCAKHARDSYGWFGGSKKL